VELSGSNVRWRWRVRLGSESELRVQAYWSHDGRVELNLTPDTDIFDVEVQHSLGLGSHRLLWGGGYRQARDEVVGSAIVAFIPRERKLAWESLFVQDELRLARR